MDGCAGLRLARMSRYSCGLLASCPRRQPHNACRNGYFPRESTNYGLAKIKGAAGDAIYFHGDHTERRPDDQACRLQTYVIPRDEVLVSQAAGKFACSWWNLARAPRRLAESPRQRAFNSPAIQTNNSTAWPE